MQRRKFIKDTITGLPIVIITPSLLSSCNNEGDGQKANGKTVIIVGAGISGLAAAKKLKENGFNVIVLEAQSKVGGRLKTNRSLGVAFDEGASWIHGTAGNPITSLAQQAGMNTAFTDDESILAYDLGGVLHSDSNFSDTEDKFYSVLETLKNNGSSTKSFETVFNELYPTYCNDRLWKFFLSTYLTFDT